MFCLDVISWNSFRAIPRPCCLILTCVQTIKQVPRWRTAKSSDLDAGISSIQLHTVRFQSLFVNASDLDAPDARPGPARAEYSQPTMERPNCPAAPRVGRRTRQGGSPNTKVPESRPGPFCVELARSVRACMAFLREKVTWGVKQGVAV